MKLLDTRMTSLTLATYEAVKRYKMNQEKSEKSYLSVEASKSDDKFKEERGI